MLFALALMLSSFCGKKKPAPDPKLVAAGKPLEGKWRQAQEFGEQKRPAAEQPILVLGKTSYTHIPPKKLGSPTIKGTWRVKKADGKNLLIGLTFDGIGPVDDQRVKVVDHDTVEWRNSKNGHGGVYKRMK